MNGVGIPAIDRLSQVINNASNTQQSITGIVAFDEILQTEIKKIKEKKLQEQVTTEKSKESFEFKPDEIQTLVYRNKENVER